MSSNASVESRKLFVGGLSADTNEKDLTDYFTKYGAVEGVVLKKDPNTQRSRGFGFVTFESESSLNEAAAVSVHLIKGKKINPRKAKVQTSKLFVGGLRDAISDDDIKNHFSQYGVIADAELPYDKNTKKRKGFCFIVYEGEKTAFEVIKKGKQSINGVQVDVKKAVPLEQQQGGGRGGRGGFGGGRGGYDAGYGGGYGAPPAYGYDAYGGDYDYSGYGGGYDYSGYGAGGYGADYMGGYGNDYSSNGYAPYSGQPGYGGGKVGAPRGRGAPRSRPY